MMILSQIHNVKSGLINCFCETCLILRSYQYTMSKQKSVPQKKASAPLANKLPFNAIYLYLPALLGIIAYLNTLGHQYALDDFSVIKDNFIVKRGISGISTLFTTDYRFGYWTSPGTLYRPLSLVMFALEWHFFPDNPMISHLLNVSLFGLSIFILTKFLLKLIPNDQYWIAILAAGIFAVHPIHTEVIANIKSRDEILNGLFSIMALWFFIRSYQNEKSIPDILMGLFCYFLALLSKESAITLLAIFPATGLLLDGKVKKALIKSAPYVIPAVLFLLLRKAVIGGNISLDQTSILDNFIVGASNTSEHLGSAVLMLGYYLFGFLIPIRQVHDLGFNQIPLVGLFSPLSLLAALVHIGMLVYIFMKWNKKDPIAYGLWFYLVGMSVASNLFITIGTSYGERLAYVPSIGLSIALVGLILRFMPKQTTGKSVFRKGPMIICLVFLFACIGKTISRNPVWYNSLSLYETDVKYCPNAAKVNFHYGLELGKKALEPNSGKTSEEWRKLAIIQDEKVIAIYPKYTDAYSHMGLMYYHLKQQDKALGLYKKSIEMGDNDPKTFSNMGTLLSEMNRVPESVEAYQKAVKIDPRFVDARRNLGCMLARLGNFKEAVKEFETALEYAPEDPDILFFMGSAYRDGGDPAKGSELLERAYALKPALKR